MVKSLVKVALLVAVAWLGMQPARAVAPDHYGHVQNQTGGAVTVQYRYRTEGNGPFHNLGTVGGGRTVRFALDYETPVTIRVVYGTGAKQHRDYYITRRTNPRFVIYWQGSN